MFGHCCPFGKAVAFVYTYHIIVFFFVAGALYNPDKYADRPLLFVKSKLKNLWLPYFLYYFVFCITNDLFYEKFVGMNDFFTPVGEHGIKGIVTGILKSAVFRGRETLGGPMWFIPFFLLVTVAFELTVFVSGKLFGKGRDIAVAAVCTAAGVTALVLYALGVSLPFHMIGCLAMLPAVFIGYAVRMFGESADRFFRPWAALPCAAVLIFVSVKGYRIDIAADEFCGVLMFYPVSFCGIYTVCTAAKYLIKFKPAEKVLSYVGGYTFDIMALHFSVIFAVRCLSEVLPGSVTPFLWAVSLLAGVFLPPLVRMGAAKIYAPIKSKISARREKNIM